MLRFFVLSLFLYSSAALCARNGIRVSSAEYPNILYLKKSKCSAIVLSRNWALSLAHCFTNRKFDNLYDSNNDYKAKVLKVKILSKERSEELALIKIKSTKDYWPERISKIYDKLPTSSDILFQVGFGRGINEKFAQSLKKTELAFSEIYEEKRWPMISLKPIDHLNAHPCQGDSGSPLFIEKNGVTYLLGITSFINHSQYRLGKKSDRQICKQANRSYFIPLYMFQDFIFNI